MNGSSRSNISVVIPTYNRAALVGRAVRSVMDQTCPPHEVVVVDDGSTDDTRAELQSIEDPRIRYVYQANAGATSARNRGASLATGQYVTFLDSDDEVAPGWLAKMEAAFADGADIVCCGVTRRTHGRVGPPVEETLLPCSMGGLFHNIVGRFLGGSFALRAPIFEHIGGYTPTLRSGHHTELALRLVPQVIANGWKIANIPESLVVVHVHEGPKVRGDSEAVLAGTEYILDHYTELLRRDRKAHALYYSVAAAHASKLGQEGKAREYSRLALKTNPLAWKHWARWVARYTVPRLLLQAIIT